MQQPDIDGGRPFDWSRTAADYARYRDIYPPAFYRCLRTHGVGLPGQRVLDIGTGTGVVPRALYAEGARFTGVDPAPGQIGQARRLAAEQGMDIAFHCVPAEEMDFPDASFDAAIACQCYFYLDHVRLAPLLHRLLRPGGLFVITYMAWLPAEDAVAAASEALALRYNPAWTGGGEVRRPIPVPDAYGGLFRQEAADLFDVEVPFTRESWNGRMKACRGVGAALPPEQVAAFETEHLALLANIAPPQFTVLHYVAAAVLRRIDGTS